MAVVLFVGAATASAVAQGRAVVAEKAPVYLYPTTAREPLATLDVHTELRVLAEEGDWIRVEFRDNRFGPRIGYVEKKKSAVFARSRAARESPFHRAAAPTTATRTTQART